MYMTALALALVLMWAVFTLLWFNGLKIPSKLGVAKE